MGDFDGSIVHVGDWMYPLCPRETFTSMLNDDAFAETNVNYQIENMSAHLFQGLEGQSAFEYPGTVNQTPLDIVAEENINPNVRDESQTSNRGGFSERIVTRSGFNANGLRLNTERNKPQDFSGNSQILSPWWTTTPDLVSPSVPLDSPVFINNPQVLPSPTVGKFTIAPGGVNQHSALPIDDFDKGKEDTTPDFNASSFAFNDANSFSYLSATDDRVNSNYDFAPESLVGPNVSDTSFQPQSIEALNVYMQRNAGLFQQADVSRQPDINGENNLLQAHNACGITNLSPPLEEPQENDVNGTIEDSNASGDGYNWRKYGQKNVLGSQFPRSYFKCLVTGCPARKQVQQSVGGHHDIAYKGHHNHPKSSRNHSSALGETQPASHEQLLNGLNGDPTWSSMNQNNLDPTYSLPQGQGYENGSSSILQTQNVNELMNGSSILSSDRDDGHVTHYSEPSGLSGEGGETQTRKRKIQCYTPDMGASRSSKQPRVVFMTKSEIDMIDDGYRWRKYGQKVVQGNPNPRSYYKCTSNNCNVRRHIERAATDLECVITTYEGFHNHGIPPSRNSLYFSAVLAKSREAKQASSNSNICEPSQVHSGVARYKRRKVDSSSLPASSSQLGSGAGSSHGTMDGQ